MALEKEVRSCHNNVLGGIDEDIITMNLELRERTLRTANDELVALALAVGASPVSMSMSMSVSTYSHVYSHVHLAPGDLGMPISMLNHADACSSDEVESSHARLTKWSPREKER